MPCVTCEWLLFNYKRSVHVFADEVSRSLEAPGSDSSLSTPRLRQACEYARDAMIEHRRLEHDGFFPPKSGSS